MKNKKQVKIPKEKLKNKKQVKIPKEKLKELEMIISGMKKNINKIERTCKELIGKNIYEKIEQEEIAKKKGIIKD